MSSSSREGHQLKQEDASDQEYSRERMITTPKQSNKSFTSIAESTSEDKIVVVSNDSVVKQVTPDKLTDKVRGVDLIKQESPERDSPTSDHSDDAGDVAASKKHLVTPDGTSTTTNPNDTDVLCGRGGSINTHPGNETFRKLVERRKRVYLTARFKREKRLIASSIVKEIRALNPPGRFLSRDPKTGVWYDIGDEKARDKTSQALRENAPTIRKEIETENDAKRAAMLKEEEDARAAAASAHHAYSHYPYSDYGGQWGYPPPPPHHAPHHPHHYGSNYHHHHDPAYPPPDYHHTEGYEGRWGHDMNGSGPSMMHKRGEHPAYHGYRGGPSPSPEHGHVPHHPGYVAHPGASQPRESDSPTDERRRSKSSSMGFSDIPKFMGSVASSAFGDWSRPSLPSGFPRFGGRSRRSQASPPIAALRSSSDMDEDDDSEQVMPYSHHSSPSHHDSTDMNTSPHAVPAQTSTPGRYPVQTSRRSASASPDKRSGPYYPQGYVPKASDRRSVHFDTAKKNENYREEYRSYPESRSTFLWCGGGSKGYEPADDDDFTMSNQHFHQYQEAQQASNRRRTSSATLVSDNHFQGNYHTDDYDQELARRREGHGYSPTLVTPPTLRHSVSSPPVRRNDLTEEDREWPAGSPRRGRRESHDQSDLAVPRSASSASAGSGPRKFASARRRYQQNHPSPIHASSSRDRERALSPGASSVRSAASSTSNPPEFFRPSQGSGEKKRTREQAARQSPQSKNMKKFNGNEAVEEVSAPAPITPAPVSGTGAGTADEQKANSSLLSQVAQHILFSWDSGEIPDAKSGEAPMKKDVKEEEDDVGQEVELAESFEVMDYEDEEVELNPSEAGRDSEVRTPPPAGETAASHVEVDWSSRVGGCHTWIHESLTAASFFSRSMGGSTTGGGIGVGSGANSVALSPANSIEMDGISLCGTEAISCAGSIGGASLCNVFDNEMAANNNTSLTSFPAPHSDRSVGLNPRSPANSKGTPSPFNSERSLLGPFTAADQSLISKAEEHHKAVMRGATSSPILNPTGASSVANTSVAADSDAILAETISADSDIPRLNECPISPGSHDFGVAWERKSGE